MSNRSVLALRSACAASLMCVALSLGCGSGSSSHVSGKIMFNGKAVPAGKVYILPDAAKGNTGAAGFADIKDGVYNTKLEGGKAAPKGAVIFAIEGIDPVPPPNASPDVTTTVLFPRYEVGGDLPAATSTKDIEVPATAANRPAQAAFRGP